MKPFISGLLLILFAWALIAIPLILAGARPHSEIMEFKAREIPHAAPAHLI
ncbi:MAG: hypothetical protein L0Y57_12755 [Beijerinckiaceae bacterium]|nr:hypothetical protein [Beijerinckiaceae bacterium]